MTTREYLGQIQKYDKLIKNKKYEEEHLRSLALGLKSFSYGEKVQSTPNPNQMTDAVSELVDIQTEIKKMVIEYTKKKQDIIETIDKVSDINSDLYNLLFRRYVKDERLEMIACEMGYSYSHVKLLHSKALNIVKNIKNFES